MSAFGDGLAEGTVSIQVCAVCHHWQVPDRLACANCGSASLARKNAAGRGTVYAVTTVCRAPDTGFHAILPYDLVLVDLIEGPRIMAHGEPGLTIGNEVFATVCTIAGRPLLQFARINPAGPGHSN